VRPVATVVRPCGHVAERRGHFLDAENASPWGFDRCGLDGRTAQLLYLDGRSDLGCGWRRRQEQCINQREFLHQSRLSKPLSNSLRRVPLSRQARAPTPGTPAHERNTTSEFSLICNAYIKFQQKWDPFSGANQYRTDCDSLRSRLVSHQGSLGNCSIRTLIENIAVGWCSCRYP